MAAVLWLAVLSSYRLPLSTRRRAHSVVASRAPTVRLCDDAVSATEAAEFLGLDAASSRDVAAYLKRGQTLLGEQVALLPPAVAPSKSGALGDALELTCLKLAQLGATVTLLADSPNILVAWRARVRYPRCSVALANVTDPHSLAYALHGKAAVVVGAPLSEQATEALVSVLSGRVSAESLLGPGPQRRVVVLSSVDVYGDAPAGVLGEADVDADGGGDADDGAAALRKFERALLDEPALGGALSVLRACPLFGDAQLDALLSDALGIEELLDDFVATLRERTGLDVDGGRKAELEAAMAATLPPRDAEMQLTHTDDLAGAAVFAIVDGALDGAYHVASAPATLQSIFDASAARRGWSSLALRPADGEGAGPPPAVFSTEKLAAAGYELLWPTIGGAPPIADAAPSADV